MGDSSSADAPSQVRSTWRARLGRHAAQHRWVQRTRAFYHRHQRSAPIVFFFGGVLWDAATLRRIDYWVDNVLLLAYLVILGGLMVAATLHAYGRAQHPWLERYADWFPAAIQFFLGALLSAYVVYYTQSASLTESMVYLVLLVVLLVANEFIHRSLVNLYLLLALYYLAASSFFIFFIPVIVKQTTYATFVAALVLSALVVGAMIRLFRRKGVWAQRRQYLGALGGVALLFGTLNLFYLQSWIPPVPLALRYGGVFHHVERTNGAYLLRYEAPPWYEFWRPSDGVFHHRPGEPVYVFTAIFAPTDLTQRIVHQWRHYDAQQDRWLVTDRLDYQVRGGRQEGFRGYTFKRQIVPGRWRVDVETPDGRVLGRIRFEVVPADTTALDLPERVYE